MAKLFFLSFLLDIHEDFLVRDWLFSRDRLVKLALTYMSPLCLCITPIVIRSL